MDAFLGRVTSQAMNYAIRSGVSITATYAIKQCGRLLKETPRSLHREELIQLQMRLESKMRIISPSIDMIDLISARGNTSLESAVSLTKEIRYEIQRLGTRLSQAANDEELLRQGSSRAKSRDETEDELKAIIAEIKRLLIRIEDAVPLINLAITTSGVNLSTNLSGSISPSRLLQASTFLSAADSNYAAQPGKRVQVGPTYTLSMYMLFAGHALRPVDEEGVRETTWKEVIHKARVKLMRVPLEELYDLPGESKGSAAIDSIPGEAKAAEFAYQLLVIEDLDDDRVHTFEDDEQQPGPFEDVAMAGIKDLVPVHEISKIFYADTGKILNIGGGDGDTHNPVLLLRRDVHAEPPRRMMHRSQMGDGGYYDDSVVVDEDDVQNDGQDDMQSEIDAQIHRESAPNTPAKESSPPKDTTSTWRLPADLDPEWMAFEVYTEEQPDSSSEDETSRPTSSSNDQHPQENLTSALSNLHLNSPLPKSRHLFPQIKTSLSLLDSLLKLTALQTFRQESHLATSDELLNFFLEDAATAGTGPDKDLRQRTRREAVRRVGFDPYDESPVKRRGEGYIRDAGAGAGIEPPVNLLPAASPSPSTSGMSATPPPTTNATRSSPKPRTGSQASLLATPPSSARSQQATVKSAGRTGSPLVRQVDGDDD